MLKTLESTLLASSAELCMSLSLGDDKNFTAPMTGLRVKKVLHIRDSLFSVLTLDDDIKNKYNAWDCLEKGDDWNGCSGLCMTSLKLPRTAFDDGDDDDEKHYFISHVYEVKLRNPLSAEVVELPERNPSTVTKDGDADDDDAEKDDKSKKSKDGDKEEVTPPEYYLFQVPIESPNRDAFVSTIVLFF